MKILRKIKLKIFNNNLEKERKKAEEIYKTKGNVVICKYCGGLLNKSESGCVYDFKEKKLEFFHERCFNENEQIRTLEDLLKE